MSYSFMQILGTPPACTIKQFYNILIKKTKSAEKLCICRDSSVHPLQGRCKEEPIVYTATRTYKFEDKSTPQNSQKQSGMPKMQKKPTDKVVYFVKR